MKKLKIIFYVQVMIILTLSVPVYLNTFLPVYVIKGTSMLPSLPSGSIIVISKRKSDIENLTGKVAVFYNPVLKSIVAHRVLDTKDGLIITKGDNNPTRDSFRPSRKDIFGVVICKKLL